MKKREQKRIEAKIKVWDESMRGFDRFYNRMKKEVKYNVTNWLDWYFGDGKMSTLNKFMHRVGILAVDIILLRILRLI